MNMQLQNKNSDCSLYFITVFALINNSINNQLKYVVSNILTLTILGRVTEITSVKVGKEK